ncbi:tRNA (5-methylaminomethyl-2-thiouridine)(34)-methyltransferase MnmD [Eisenibacter elegans]|jgi:tRNA U34 5-methylaminomethyl-2-thiouridine-forming methyltransferase MnmC|uniref:tRNA (5-methylaminomethyl-2-thiouridine)(34)-methyltransferase MnmD n=1 Tax=Eisenibacter elegans TaxID=997 RepID=UPI00040DE0CD|nr:tRNA (5-methylaminomethyl-2-thiouridine)(34)-methyltransferase MnmD [Eisenibacter elegans]
MSDIEIHITDDGSQTLFSRRFNEIYHSRQGAIEESQHVFIDAGLRYIAERYPVVRLLEVGFGTGLNALLTFQAMQQSYPQQHLSYTGLEPFPIPMEIVSQLLYPAMVDEALTPLYHQLHAQPAGEVLVLEERLSFCKIASAIQHYEHPQPDINLVYFDAFAPTKQPEMWDYSVLESIYRWMATDAVLVTYCAKGQFKRDLKAIGFEVESLPGPNRKREMVRAHKR